MNGHERMREMLARRAELSNEDERRLEEHLGGCPECRETAFAYARQTALLRSVPVVDPPPALRAGVMQGIRAPRPLPFWRRQPALLLSPLAAVLLLVAGALAFFNRSHETAHQNAAGSHATPLSLTSAPKSTFSGPKSTMAPSPTAGHLATPRRRPVPTPGHPLTTTIPNPSGEVALGTVPGPQPTSRTLGYAQPVSPTTRNLLPAKGRRHPPFAASRPRPGGRTNPGATTTGGSTSSSPAPGNTPIPTSGVPTGVDRKPTPVPPTLAPQPTTGPTGVIMTAPTHGTSTPAPSRPPVVPPSTPQPTAGTAIYAPGPAPTSTPGTAVAPPPLPGATGTPTP